MKKRDWILLIALCGVFVVVLVAGEVKTKQQEHLQYQAYLTYSKAQNNTPLITTGSSPENMPLNDLDTVDYLNEIAKTSTPTIVAIGSSGTAGVGITDPNATWFHLLTDALKQRPGLMKLKAYNLASASETTTSLLNGTQITQARDDKANVVLVETCAMTDWYQGVPEQTSLSNLKAIVSKVQGELPDSRIILYSPNPIVDTTNLLNLTYGDYLTNEKREAIQQKWDFIDVNGEMSATVSSGNYQLSQLITQTYYPSVQGDRLWEEDILKGLESDGRQASG